MLRQSSWQRWVAEAALTLFSFLAGITFLAYVVKGLTGFGPAIVFITLGSLCMDPVRIVAISPVLDITAGGYLLWRDRSYSSAGYWLILGVPLLFGVLIGSLGLRMAQSHNYSAVLGTAIALLGTWFVFRRRDRLLQNVLPQRPEPAALITAVCSGICGGLFGISGPPLIWYFGSRFERAAFRQIVVPLFFMESFSRVLIYMSLGMLPLNDLTYSARLLPFLFLGLIVGNIWFNRLPQARFERIVGMLLILLGVKIAFF